MEQPVVVWIESLPDSALDAAAAFHARYVGEIRAALADGAESVVVRLPDAPQDHRGWRHGVVQDLARMASPARVNALEGGSTDAIAAAWGWLAHAPGVTGQLFKLDGQGAGNPAHCAA
jgi:hypothetical protein